MAGTNTLPHNETMETDELSLRKAGPDDHEAVLEVVLHHRREMFREMGFSDLVSWAQAEPLSREFFGNALKDGRYHAWFLEDGSGHVVSGAGVILLDYHPSPVNPTVRRPWVVNVYTEHQWRRHGLARRLMDVTIAWAREQGYANLFLHASDDGRPLYEALGFAPTNEMLLKL
jgi:GNAT superfamily N-acetyltransferase